MSSPPSSSPSPSAVVANRASTKIARRREPFYLGGLASCAAAFVSHPFDLAKVRLQTIQGQAKNGMLKTMVLIVKNEGLFAIYNGLSASLLRQITYSTVRFGAYDLLKEKIAQGRSPTFAEMIFCSVTAGCMGGAVGNPADMINVRMQNDGSLPAAQRRNYKHAVDGLVRVVREEGVKSLARGLGPNINRAILMTTSQLVSYDVFKSLLVGKAGWRGDGIGTHFGASLLAGLVATTVCSPVDVVKTRVMNSTENKSAISICANMVRKEGPQSLFKGWTPAFVRLGPHTIVTFMVLEQLKRLHGYMEDRRIAKLTGEV